MFMVMDKTSAIFLMIVSLWCLGSWPAFFNVLERRGRLPQHTYMDYAISTYMVPCVLALTLGQMGPQNDLRPNFIEQLGQNNLPSVLFAMAGGVALCIGNITMQYSLAFIGISLTEVVSASIAVVGGTTVNYFLDKGLNRASILFPGVGCFLVAAILGSFCHASNSADTKCKLDGHHVTGTDYASLGLDEKAEGSKRKKFAGGSSDGPLPTSYDKWNVGNKAGDMETGAEDKWLLLPDDKVRLDHDEASAGSAEYLEHLEETRAIKVRSHGVMFGLAMAFFTGLCYAMFSPLFNLATNDQFHLLETGVPHLAVYTSFFYFSTSFFFMAIAVNIFFLYHPILGLPKSSISAYMTDWKGRHLAVLAGLVCGLGNAFQFMGGQAAGYAAADAVQALPLVGTFWGVLIFGEYHRSSRTTYVLLGAMISMFMVAVTVLIASSTERC